MKCLPHISGPSTAIIFNRLRSFSSAEDQFSSLPLFLRAQVHDAVEHIFGVEV